VRDGVKDELKSGGFDAGKTLKYEYQSAQGNTGTRRRSPASTSVTGRT